MTDESTILQGGALGASYNRHLSNPDALEADPDQSVKDYALSDLRIGGVVLSPWNPDTDKFLQADGGVANPLLYPQLPPAYVFADQTILDKDYQGLAISDAGLMVAVATGDADAQTSTDGETWTLQAAAIPAAVLDYHCLAFGAGLFVLVYTDSCYTSPDGATWTSRTIPAGAYDCVFYGNGLFVAAGVDVISTSPDGITWTALTFTDTVTFTSGAFGSGKYILVSSDGLIYASTDGIVFTEVYDASPGSLLDIVYGNGVFVAVGTFGLLLISYDGLTWASVSVDADNWDAVDHNGHAFLATNVGTQAYVSVDGENWNEIATPPSVRTNEIANYGGRWIAVSSGGVVSLTADLELPTLAGDNDWLYWVKVA